MRYRTAENALLLFHGGDAGIDIPPGQREQLRLLFRAQTGHGGGFAAADLFQNAFRFGKPGCVFRPIVI